MKIAIDARSYGARHFTGIGRYITELIAALERLDSTNDYTIVLCDMNHEEYAPTSVRFKRVLVDARPYTLREQLVVPSALNRLRVDLVHFPANFGPIAYRGRRVTTIHDLSMLTYPPSSQSGLRGRLESSRAVPARIAMWQGVRSSAAIIANSQTTAASVRQRYPRSDASISVAYEGVSALSREEDGHRSERLPEPPFLLFVGLCYPHKNLTRLLGAFRLLRQWMPDLGLVIAGRVDLAYDRTRRLAADMGLAAHVHFPGRVDDGELAWLYRHAEAFVFPSLAEGFGLPGIEAMTLGTPVIAARASCLPEVYGDAAAYLDPYDEESMARDLWGTLSDVGELARLRREGPLRAATFDWDDTARATMAVYASLDPHAPISATAPRR